MTEELSPLAQKRRENKEKTVEMMEAVNLNEEGSLVMTSLQIAEVTGKNHRDVLRAIRNLEPAWEKVSRRKFPLVEYMDAKGEMRPYYVLNALETIYIAAKFNDEARAKLVLRWAELEKQAKTQAQAGLQLTEDTAKTISGFKERLDNLKRDANLNARLIQQQAMYTPAVVRNNILQAIAKADDVTYTVTSMAKQIGISASELNRFLMLAGVQENIDGEWHLTPEYYQKGYAHRVSSSSRGYSYLVWTPEGFDLILELAASYNDPLAEY